MHESSTTVSVCTATCVTDSPAQRYRRHLLMKTNKTRSIPCDVPSLPDADGFDVMKMEIMRRNTYNVMKMKY